MIEAPVFNLYVSLDTQLRKTTKIQKKHHLRLVCFVFLSLVCVCVCGMNRVQDSGFLGMIDLRKKRVIMICSFSLLPLKCYAPNVGTA